MSLYGSVGASSVRGAHPLPTGPAPSRKRKDRDDPDARSPGSSNYFHYYNNNNGSTHSPPLSSSSSSSTSSPSSSSLLGLPRPPHVRQPPLVEQRLGKQLLSPNPVAAPIPAVAAPANTPTPLAKPGGNRLLMAGYLAHEFLSRGTLFGRPYGTSGGGGAAAAALARKEEMQQKRKQQYEEVARILWGGGAHVPGVINPTQLGAWLQKQQEK